MKTIMIRLCMAGVILVAKAKYGQAAPLSTAFTYQGQLKDTGVPADDTYDMRFSLFSAASAGGAVAGPLIFDGAPGNGAPVDVTNGLFNVVLDFGPVYDGTALWLHVEVRNHGVGGYSALTPRQPLTATPFAIFALDGPGQAGFWQANGNHIYKSNSGSVGIGATDPQANLEVRSSGTPRLRVAKIHTGGFGTFAPAVLELKSNFTGTDLPYGRVNFLDGADTVRGTIEYGGAPGLLAPVSLRLGTAGQTRLAITDAGDVGIGTTAPANRLSVVGSADLTGNLGLGTTMPANRLSVVGSANLTGSLGIGLSTPLVKLHVGGGSDTSPGGGGFIVTGDMTGANVSIDNNEIMARNAGNVAPLFLNANGGDVVVGGALDIGLQIITAHASDELSVQATCPAGMRVIGGGCASTEILRQSDSGLGGAYSWVCVTDDYAADTTATAICARVK